MAEEPLSKSLRRRYELRDAPAKLIVYFALGLAAAIVAVLILLWFQYQSIMGVSPAKQNTDASAWSYAARELTGIKQEKGELQADESRRLETYRWIDVDSNTAGIPLERAMRIAAEQGLPQWGEKNKQLKPIDMINEQARKRE